MALKGIDISTYQGYPDWEKVKKSGMDFAIIKATQGRAESSNSYLFTDSKFKYNITNAAAVGIKCGVYHYFTARSAEEARKEAEYFVSAIAPYKHLIALYAAVDVESVYLKGVSKVQLTDLVKFFCDQVRAAGFKPIVYTNPDWLKNRLNGTGGYPLWLALWRNKLLKPFGYTNMQIWQYGGEKVNGISGKVDSNFGYFDLPETAAPKSPAKETVSAGRESIKAGDTVRVENPVNYDTGKPFRCYYGSYTVMQITGKRAVIGVDGTVTAAVHVDNIELLEAD